MDDGSEEEFSTNDAMMLPPGHDAWCVGGGPCVFVEFSRQRLLRLVVTAPVAEAPR